MSAVNPLEAAAMIAAQQQQIEELQRTVSKLRKDLSLARAAHEAAARCVSVLNARLRDTRPECE